MTFDYLIKYRTDDAIDLPRLINDDFFEPIRLLYQARHYVSATKLLLVFIDTAGYIEYGDGDRNPFIAWLNSVRPKRAFFTGFIGVFFDRQARMKRGKPL